MLSWFSHRIVMRTRTLHPNLLSLFSNCAKLLYPLANVRPKLQILP